MSIQIAVRLNAEELNALDVEVQEGRASSRSEAIRRGVAHLTREQRYRGEEAKLIEIARRGEAVYPDLEGILDLPSVPLD
ncbi:MAG: ribbon-helix-helix domain-containing protein [Actinomycetota bacterium]|nr:ribbon-helix-helix domain-containing protein [Actinomycetota bacterium]